MYSVPLFCLTVDAEHSFLFHITVFGAFCNLADSLIQSDIFVLVPHVNETHNPGVASALLYQLIHIFNSDNFKIEMYSQLVEQLHFHNVLLTNNTKIFVSPCSDL
jgi:DUF1009 family protein